VREHRRVRIAESTQVGEARRAAVGLANVAGFDDTAAGKVAIVVSEAATNILKHATRGEVIVSAVADPAGSRVEVLAIDRGPGMDYAQCSVDRYTTIPGSRGEGLGAITRLASRVDVYSPKDAGTVLFAEVRAGEPKTAASLEVGGFTVPFEGEARCGDAFDVALRPDGARAIVSDGLGHGDGAADASARALECFAATADLPLDEVLERLHVALKRTRGAAIAVAELDLAAREVSYAGVGNITASIIPETPASAAVSMVSTHGTIGHSMRNVQTFTYTLPHRAVVVLCSDGVSARWNLDDYSELIGCHPSVIAGVIYRDFKRPNEDDVAVLVMREAERKT